MISRDVKTSANSFKSNGLYGQFLYAESESQYKKIIPYLESSFKIEPNQAQVNFLLGTLYGKYENDYDRSTYYLNNALILDSTILDAYNNLGVMYRISKQYNKAIYILEKGLKISPNYSLILYNLSLSYKCIGDTTKANYYHTKSLH